MKLEAPKNANYAATLVELKTFVDLPNCDNIKAALIFGCSVIVGKDCKEGDMGLFFPVETALSKEFLGANNLFRDAADGNVDPSKKGFFNASGRVKCVKFRTHKSEGFFIPVQSLEYIGEFELKVGDTFDTLEGHEICHKYVPFKTPGAPNTSQKRGPKLKDQIVEGQFLFHYDTSQLKRNYQKVLPTDYISISDKWHGTSVIIAKVLTVSTLSWYQRLLGRLGAKLRLSEYGMVYSSRKVVKAVNGVEKGSANHYYSEDIWGVVAREVEDRIPLGYTLYGEIVGYTPEGRAIQPGYHYGCEAGSHKLVIYRVTVTNAEGRVLELSWMQMKAFCLKFGFEMVKEIWYGRAMDRFEELKPWADVRWDGGPQDWQEMFMEKMAATYAIDEMCPYNLLDVPAEGVVLRIDRLEESEAFKLKSFRFLEWETKQLDKGASDMESEQSEEPGEALPEAA